MFQCNYVCFFLLFVCFLVLHRKMWLFELLLFSPKPTHLIRCVSRCVRLLCIGKDDDEDDGHVHLVFCWCCWATVPIFLHFCSVKHFIYLNMRLQLPCAIGRHQPAASVRRAQSGAISQWFRFDYVPTGIIYTCTHNRLPTYPRSHSWHSRHGIMHFCARDRGKRQRWEWIGCVRCTCLIHTVLVNGIITFCLLWIAANTVVWIICRLSFGGNRLIEWYRMHVILNL